MEENNNRFLFLIGEINAKTTLEIVKKLLYLDDINHDDIILYISSPGGSVVDGDNLIYIMNKIKSNIITVCLSGVCSMGAFIFMNGDKRYMLKHSKVMFHSASNGINFRNINAIKENIKRIKEINNDIKKMLEDKTTLSKDEINDMVDNRNRCLSSEFCKKNNIVDKIL